MEISSGALVKLTTLSLSQTSSLDEPVGLHQYQVSSPE
jgi:hypothetical protein